MGDKTGFDGDSFEGRKINGLQEGVVVNRNDPELRSRIKVRIPGLIDTESAWAPPIGAGGARRHGKNSVPPLNATVDVWFVNGDPNRPKYVPGDHGIVDGESQAFPEHESPDVHVFGIGPFRLVIDNREGQRVATAKIVKEINGQEEAVVYGEFNYEDNSFYVHSDSAFGLHSGAIVDIDCEGDVQVRGRKVMPTSKVI